MADQTFFDNPFGNSPFGASSPFGNSSPFGPSNPFDTKPTTPSPTGGLDLDAMLKDIDKKIAELDAEEAKQKELENKNNSEPAKIESKKEENINDKSLDIKPLDLGLDNTVDISKSLEPKNDFDLKPEPSNLELNKNPFATELSDSTGHAEKNISKPEPDNDLNFKIPDLDTLLANLAGDDKIKDNDFLLR